MHCWRAGSRNNKEIKSNQIKSNLYLSLSLSLSLFFSIYLSIYLSIFTFRPHPFYLPLSSVRFERIHTNHIKLCNRTELHINPQTLTYIHSDIALLFLFTISHSLSISINPSFNHFYISNSLSAILIFIKYTLDNAELSFLKVAILIC